MSIITQKGKGGAASKTESDPIETGIGESENFLTEENHLFINKLNYICKNYDQSFKDVSCCLKI